jgi:hypothetical protein
MSGVAASSKTSTEGATIDGLQVNIPLPGTAIAHPAKCVLSSCPGWLPLFACYPC